MTSQRGLEVHRVTVWTSECRQPSWITDRVQRANFRLWRQSDPDRRSLCSSMAEWSVPSRCSGAIEPGTALRQQADAAPVIHDLALSGLEQPLHLAGAQVELPVGVGPRRAVSSRATPRAEMMPLARISSIAFSAAARLAVVSPQRWARAETSAPVRRDCQLHPRTLAAFRAALVRALIKARSFCASAA